MLKVRVRVFPINHIAAGFISVCMLVLFTISGTKVFAAGSTYYVSPSGANTNCSQVDPCTLTYALATKVVTDDTVKVLPGTYNITAQIVQKSTASNVTVEASDINNKPIIDGTLMPNNRLIQTYGGTFRNLIFKNVGRIAGYKPVIESTATAPMVLVEDNQFINSGSAFLFSGTNDIFRYNYIYGAYGGVSTNGQTAGKVVSVYHNIFAGAEKAYVGSATSGDATTLNDTATNFATQPRVFPGNIIRNITDGSWGIAKSASGNTVVFDSPMSSGAWGVGDRYEIYGGYVTSSYAMQITGSGTINVYNNTFVGNDAVRVMTSFTNGIANIKNNAFVAARAGYNITNTGTGTVNLSDNYYLNGEGVGSGVSEGMGNLSGLTDSGINKLTNWNLDPKVNLSSSYLMYRFDDTSAGSCPSCTYNYYKDIAIKMKQYNQKAVVGIDVAEVGDGLNNDITWDDIRELQSVYGWEIASHGLSHISLATATSTPSPFSASYIGGGSGAITVNFSGTVPSDSGSVTITENTSSITIDYPLIQNLVNTGKRTTGSNNDPWDYTVTNNGMPSYSGYDLGSVKGLRDYIDSLPNWTATVIPSSFDFTNNTPARELANAAYTNPSSTAINLDVTRTHYWEIGYSKAVIEAQVGGGYTCTTLIYPNFSQDVETIKSLINYSYTAGMGSSVVTGTNLLGSFNLFQISTTPMAGIVSRDTNSNGTSGEEEDIRFGVRSIAYSGAGDQRVVGYISHNFADVASMNQWDYIVNEVSKLPVVSIKTPKEIANMLRTSGNWTSPDGNVFWERTSYPVIQPKPSFGSPLINTGINLSFTRDFLGTSIPQGASPDKGAYEYLMSSAPSNLRQYKSDGSTSLGTGQYTNNNTIVTKFDTSSSNPVDSVTPGVELRTSNSFTDTATHTGTVITVDNSTGEATVTLSGLSDGAYYWKAVSQNSAGSSSWSSHGGDPDFIVDTTPPEKPSASVAAGTYGVRQSVGLNVSADADSTYYTQDGTTPSKSSSRYTGPINIDGLNGTTIVLKAVSYDVAGNVSSVMSSSYTFSKTVDGSASDDTDASDNKAEIINEDILANGNEINEAVFHEGDTIRFSGKTNPYYIVHLYFHSDPFETQTIADQDGNWEYELSGRLGVGSHTIEVAVENPQTNVLSPKTIAQSFSIEAITEKSKAGTGFNWWIVSGFFMIVGIIVTMGYLLRKVKK